MINKQIINDFDNSYNALRQALIDMIIEQIDLNNGQIRLLAPVFMRDIDSYSWENVVNLHMEVENGRPKYFISTEIEQHYSDYYDDGDIYYLDVLNTNQLISILRQIP